MDMISLNLLFRPTITHKVRAIRDNFPSIQHNPTKIWDEIFWLVYWIFLTRIHTQEESISMNVGNKSPKNSPNLTGSESNKQVSETKWNILCNLSRTNFTLLGLNGMCSPIRKHLSIKNKSVTKPFSSRSLKAVKIRFEPRRKILTKLKLKGTLLFKVKWLKRQSEMNTINNLLHQTRSTIKTKLMSMKIEILCWPKSLNHLCQNRKDSWKIWAENRVRKRN